MEGSIKKVVMLRGSISDINRMTNQNNEANKKMAKLSQRQHSMLQTILIDEYRKQGYNEGVKVKRSTGEDGVIIVLLYNQETCDLDIMFHKDGTEFTSTDDNIHPIVQFILA